MKEKKMKETKKSLPVNPVPTPVEVPAVAAPAAPAAPVRVEVVERLSDPDKSVLDLAKARRETALANAKTALAQSEVSELAYNNVILQLAIRYHLVDGDIINDDGSIKRK